jgi:hypothetical protein
LPHINYQYCIKPPYPKLDFNPPHKEFDGKELKSKIVWTFTFNTRWKEKYRIKTKIILSEINKKKKIRSNQRSYPI